MAINNLRNTLLILLFALPACAAQSDKQIIKEWHAADSALLSSYDFVDLASNQITDPTGSLSSFFAALDSIQSDGAIVPIIHFGDSHIEGGMLSEAIMRRLAREYGTAGRGFITPHRLTGKNEPRDYAITASPSSSGGITIIDAESRSTNIGISGVAANCPASTELTLRIFPVDDDATDYRFSRIIAFHDSLAPIITAVDEQLLDEVGGSDIFNSFSTELNLLNATDSISLRTYTDGTYSNGAIYGFSLENGKAGVIYHSIGVNGACFLHWGRNSEVAKQSTALSPRLIIVSLGSNEAAGNNFIESVFIEQMDSFISKLRHYNVGVPILLVTPVEAMRRRGGTQTPNANFALVQAAMKSYATQNNIALYDLYQITSAKGSAENWREWQLLSRDGIHYTSQGYALQGMLLFYAILNESKRYERQQ